jgi:hypothetical protein
MSVDIFNLLELLSLVIVSTFIILTLHNVSKFFNISQNEIFFIFSYHTLISIIFLFLDLNHGLDAAGWYSKSNLNVSIFFGNDFMYFFSAILKLVGIKYLAQNMIFNYLGTLTLVIFYSKIKEFYKSYTNKVMLYFYLTIVFVPGLSFWTSGITKDVLSIFGLALFYCSISKKINYKLFLISVSFIFFSRPFLLLFFILSFFIYKTILILFSNKIKNQKKIIFFVTLIIIFYPMSLSLNLLKFYIPNMVISYDLSYLIEKIINYTKESQAFYANDRLGVPVDTNFYSRFFYFLFMPLKLDFTNILFLYFFIENIYLILFIFFVIFDLRYSPLKIPQLAKVFYLGIFLMIIYFPIALSNYGIALRYKWMIIPFLIMFFCQFKVYRKN